MKNSDEGRKADRSKPKVYRGVLASFPLGVAAVAELSEYGAKKYSWDNWQRVPDGVNRYADALLRHLLREGAGETVDHESERKHAVHVAWNALARLELILRKENGRDEHLLREGKTEAPEAEPCRAGLAYPEVQTKGCGCNKAPIAAWR